MNAKVWLVGAGPGDPELLTLKAVRLLGQADDVLVDDLVGPGVLAYCPQARIIRVGKRGWGHSTPQARILALMLKLVRRGRQVVRLKGGDPCVFGRGGEEAAWLAERGIPCEIVNGVTAGLAAATACGIPLTMRGMARGVTLVTAQTGDGSGINWQALAQGGTTLVVYMGVAALGDIRKQLLAAGMASGMPVAMIERASLPGQRHCVSSLAKMAEDAACFGLASPAILVIGPVAALGATATGLLAAIDESAGWQPLAA